MTEIVYIRSYGNAFTFTRDYLWNATCYLISRPEIKVALCLICESGVKKSPKTYPSGFTYVILFPNNL